MGEAVACKQNGHPCVTVTPRGPMADLRAGVLDAKTVRGDFGSEIASGLDWTSPLIMRFSLRPKRSSPSSSYTGSRPQSRRRDSKVGGNSRLGWKLAVAFQVSVRPAQPTKMPGHAFCLFITVRGRGREHFEYLRWPSLLGTQPHLKDTTIPYIVQQCSVQWDHIMQ